MSLTMRLGVFEKGAEQIPQNGIKGRELLGRIQQGLRQAGYAEYEETPEKPTEEPWTIRVHYGAVESFQNWIRQNHLRLALTLNPETVRHLAEVNALSAVFLPNDFSPPVIGADLSIASAPRLQQICQRAASLLGIRDITLISYDFTGLGDGIRNALNAFSEPEREWSEPWVWQFICTALYQGASLAIARHRALILE
jgi:hypothetical protein